MMKNNKSVIAGMLAILTVFGCIAASTALSLNVNAIGGLFDDTTTEAPTATEPPATESEPETDAPSDTTNATPDTAEIEIEGMMFTSEVLTIAPDETAQLEVVVTPEGAEPTEITYASSNEEIVTVDETGIVTAHKSGKANITAKTVTGNGEISCSCEIIVSTSSIRLNDQTTTGMKIASGFTIGMTAENVIAEIAMMNEINETQVSVTLKGDTVGSGNSIATGMIITIEGAEYAAVLYGDVNGDGYVNTDDARAIAEYVTGIDTLTTEPQLLAADVLHKDEITIEAALVIQRHIFGLSVIEQ